MSQTRGHLRVVTERPAAPAPHEVDVRFTPSAALGARAHGPLNSFRWIGPARLHISPQGILVNARSATLLGLRPTQRFIRAAQIQDVYREANAVQVHLRGPRHPYFRFWARDAAEAARIVTLLPTPHTIEFETALEESPARAWWRQPLAWLLALLLALALMAALAWLSGFLNAARRSVPAVAQRPAPASFVTPPPPKVAPEDALRARMDLIKYEERIQALRVEFDIAFDALMETPELERKVTVGIAPEKPGWIALSVGDNGTGIDPSVAGRVFEPFVTTKSGGMGLGLLVTQSIVEDHGGKIWLMPNAERGTTFTFTLPLMEKTIARRKVARKNTGERKPRDK